MNFTFFSFTSLLAACLTLTLTLVQAVAGLTPEELTKICNDRAQWCVRAGNAGHGAAFIQADGAQCSNYDDDKGIYAYRMCAMGDVSVAHLSCGGKVLNAHFNNNVASVDGDTASFKYLWGQNGPTTPTHTGKINLYVACS